MVRSSTAVLFLSVAMASAQTTTPRKLIASMEGKDLYMAYCASCHGVSGKEDGPAAAVLSGPLADLRTLAQRNKGKFPLAEVENVILTGQSARGGHGS